jgi:hypothetical protein
LRPQETIGATLSSTSSQLLRGDEANLRAPVDGSAIVNLSGSYALHKRAKVVARVTNLFDTDYATFGLLGEADEVLGDEFDDARFLESGASHAARVDIEFSFP